MASKLKKGKYGMTRPKIEIEFLNTKGVLLQKHFVILHLLVEFALQIKNIKNLKSFCYLKTHKRMIQKKTWHEYSNELKQFLCEVAMSRWATYP